MEEKSENEERDEDVVRDEKADYGSVDDVDEEKLRAWLTDLLAFLLPFVSERRADTVWLGTRIHVPGQDNGTSHGLERRRRAPRATPKFYSFDDAISQPDENGTLEKEEKRLLDPGQRVQQLLQQGDPKENQQIATPRRLFTEMEQLCYDGATREWRETARWVKFEEDVEEGGNRWSKPYVATLSLHSLFELRSCLLKGSVLLNLDCTDFPSIAGTPHKIVEILLKTGQIKETMQDFIHDTLLCKHRHQYENTKLGMEVLSSGQSFLQTVRSLADIGRSYSQAKNIVSVEHSTSGKRPFLVFIVVARMPLEMGYINSAAQHFYWCCWNIYN
ncbi:unnamed protein product [Soboliphyme baturini]|uniref:Band_3_cyto domain-containing protein n=1 Tax=Soboliphyme baturini TaxID=241478 RepID=A0A183IYB1_9BILA|nr:unnamed protein product [Soboliphyme baturini]